MPDPSISRITLHASCVALKQDGILILGAPGAGKSDLVLRLIDQPGYGTGDEMIRAQLVADDQTIIERRGAQLFASGPKPLAGLLEIRGQGIVTVHHVAEARLALVVRLMPVAEIERMPEEGRRYAIAGLTLPEIAIDPTLLTAAARIRAAVMARSSDELRQIRA